MRELGWAILCLGVAGVAAVAMALARTAGREDEPPDGVWNEDLSGDYGPYVSFDAEGRDWNT